MENAAPDTEMVNGFIRHFSPRTGFACIEQGVLEHNYLDPPASRPFYARISQPLYMSPRLVYTFISDKRTRTAAAIRVQTKGVSKPFSGECAGGILAYLCQSNQHVLSFAAMLITKCKSVLITKHALKQFSKGPYAYGAKVYSNLIMSVAGITRAQATSRLFYGYTVVPKALIQPLMLKRIKNPLLLLFGGPSNPQHRPSTVLASPLLLDWAIQLCAKSYQLDKADKACLRAYVQMIHLEKRAFAVKAKRDVPAKRVRKLLVHQGYLLKIGKICISGTHMQPVASFAAMLSGCDRVSLVAMRTHDAIDSLVSVDRKHSSEDHLIVVLDELHETALRSRLSSDTAVSVRGLRARVMPCGPTVLHLVGMGLRAFDDIAPLIMQISTHAFKRVYMYYDAYSEPADVLTWTELLGSRFEVKEKAANGTANHLDPRTTLRDELAMTFLSIQEKLDMVDADLPPPRWNGMSVRLVLTDALPSCDCETTMEHMVRCHTVAVGAFDTSVQVRQSLPHGCIEGAYTYESTPQRPSEFKKEILVDLRIPSLWSMPRLYTVLSFQAITRVLYVRLP